MSARQKKLLRLDTSSDDLAFDESTVMMPPPNEVMPLQASYRSSSGGAASTDRGAVSDREGTTDRGSTTERELASGDTFDVNAMPIGSSLLQSTKERTWEPVATPSGRNLYWYNWKSGESQWEMPEEISRKDGARTPTTTLPSTPKGGQGGSGETAELWKVLHARSDVVQVRGDWSEMGDRQTSEKFYFNATTQAYQWESPWEDSGKGMNPAQNDAASGDSEWEPIATPMGKALYWYNWTTGESSWTKPMGTLQGKRPHSLKSPLASTETAEQNKEKRLWHILLERAKVVTSSGDWTEYVDPQSNEQFFWNSAMEVGQWHRPETFASSSSQGLANAREASTVAKNNMTPPQQQSRRSQRQKKWEPVATPKGRNLYWWNSDTGESQWERPDEVSPAQAAAHAAHVLPATHESNTMSELTEVNQLWVTLRSRATVEAINGDWHRMNDPHTGERFYWNAVTDASQWKEPEISGKWLDPSHTDAVNSSEWTAVQTPAGRLLCYYDKVTGNSQLVQPETYAMTDRHATPELLLSVSDPRCTDVPKMRRLWTVILQRSTTQKTVSDWAELRDSTTGEIFYHCGRTEVSQWEVPDAFRHEIATQNEGGKAVHFSAAETHTSSNDHPWEAVKTPKGRNIYFWNRNTGESQWEHPDPSKQIVPVPSNGNETQDGHYLSNSSSSSSSSSSRTNFNRDPGCS